MANSKRSLFSSLFGGGKKQRKKAEEAAGLEARQKLEKRIQQVLAELAESPQPAVERNHAELITQEKEAESVVEILPITASAVSRRKPPAPLDLWPGTAKVERPYAVNEWR